MTSSLLFLFGCVLSLSVSAAPIRKGDIVYGNNGNHLVGEVLRIFGEKAEILWRSANASPINESNFWECARLYRQVDCSGTICNDDEVYGSNGTDLLGIVSRVFENGIAEVRWYSANRNRIDETTYWRVERLLKETPNCTSCQQDKGI